MKKVLLVVAIMLSLVVLPVLDAFACEKACAQTSQSDNESPIKKIDNVAHCSCHHQVADKLPFISLDKSLIIVSNSLPMLSQNPYASVTVGPLLEPPSYS